MKTFKNLFFALSGISSMFLAIAVASILLSNDPLKNLNWQFIGWLALIHIVCWVITMACVGSYFGNNIWRASNLLDDERIKLSEESKKLTKALDIIGKHEALRMIDEFKKTEAP